MPLIAVLTPQGSLSRSKYSSILEALPGLQECNVPRYESPVWSQMGSGKSVGVERTSEMHHHPYPCKRLCDGTTGKQQQRAGPGATEPTQQQPQGLGDRTRTSSSALSIPT